jgi:hypothetical protein
MSDRAGVLWLICILAFFVGTCVVMFNGYQDCQDKGGKYVRGMFWMECIGEDKEQP